MLVNQASSYTREPKKEPPPADPGTQKARCRQSAVLRCAVELGRRFRALFFFVAFVLCMSLCFVYAEDLPASRTGADRAAATAEIVTPAIVSTNQIASPEPSRPLLWTSPQHASFLQPVQARILEPRVTAAPVATPSVLLQLEAATRGRRRLFLHGRAKPRIASPSSSSSESSILDLLLHQQLLSEAGSQITQQ
jgi:hypothetical protein